MDPQSPTTPADQDPGQDHDYLARALAAATPARVAGAPGLPVVAYDGDGDRGRGMWYDRDGIGIISDAEPDEEVARAALDLLAVLTTRRALRAAPGPAPGGVAPC